MLLIIAGDASAFAYISDQLDPYDPKTGTAVPVLVISDSGGAAEDITNYCADLSLPVEDASTGRDAAYIAQAREYLPRIKELGEMTGQNSRQQLAFFKISNDLDARDDLALEIEKALLNDCAPAAAVACLACLLLVRLPVLLAQANHAIHILSHPPNHDIQASPCPIQAPTSRRRRFSPSSGRCAKLTPLLNSCESLFSPPLAHCFAPLPASPLPPPSPLPPLTRLAGARHPAAAPARFGAGVAVQGPGKGSAG